VVNADPKNGPETQPWNVDYDNINSPVGVNVFAVESDDWTAVEVTKIDCSICVSFGPVCVLDSEDLNDGVSVIGVSLLLIEDEFAGGMVVFSTPVDLLVGNTDSDEE